METDFRNSAEVDIFFLPFDFLPFDLAGEPAIQAALIPPSARALDAFQPHSFAGLYPGIE